MLPVTGYCDRWSVKPGETIAFMISSRDSQPYRARVARIFCGDPNPEGPGYRETPVASVLDGEHPGREQAAAPGSWAHIPGVDLTETRGTVSLAATIWPTLIEEHRQSILNWCGTEAELTLDLGPGGLLVGRLETAAGRAEIVADRPLVVRRWYDVGLIVDLASGRLTLAHAPRRKSYEAEPPIVVDAPIDIQAPALTTGAFTIAGRRTDGAVSQHYNGKIERPTIWSMALSWRDLLERQARPIDRAAPGLLAAWDFALGIASDVVTDIGGRGWHGRLTNLPTRAVTGASWSGRSHRWTGAPEDYAAIHFHCDDVGDMAWRPTLSLAVPDIWPSGLYALHLERDDGIDNIPFVVRARSPGEQAKVALLLPTFTYQIYGQFPRGTRNDELRARSQAWGGLEQTADQHLDYGLSAYNTHRDGSGVSLVSMRRPMIDKRVNQIHKIEVPEGSSGAYWLVCDTYIIDWLDHAGIPFDIITDHDLHAEGAGLLKSYSAILTGQHPEYHTDETLDAIERYASEGGRLMYLGGNGFYWKVVAHQQGAWALEVRRAEGGIRTWAADPGEGYHAFDGSYGGLWRRLGRPPQSIVGVGFSSQGSYKGYPYTFTEAINDPRVSFMADNLPDAAPGALFGEASFSGGGAAGHEVDRADIALGTPNHALIIASAVIEDPDFKPVNEERLTQEWPAAPDKIIRADMTFFETTGGGAVFSVGSMSLAGALAPDGYSNPTAHLCENILLRFIDKTPFTIAEAPQTRQI